MEGIEIIKLRERVAELQAERDTLADENAEFKKRVAKLETRLSGPVNMDGWNPEDPAWPRPRYP